MKIQANKATRFHFPPSELRSNFFFLLFCFVVRNKFSRLVSRRFSSVFILESSGSDNFLKGAGHRNLQGHGWDLGARQGESPAPPSTPTVVRDRHAMTLDLHYLQSPPLPHGATLQPRSMTPPILLQAFKPNTIWDFYTLLPDLVLHSLDTAFVCWPWEYHCSNDTQTFSPQWCWSLINQLIFQSQLISTHRLLVQNITNNPYPNCQEDLCLPLKSQPRFQCLHFSQYSYILSSHWKVL